MTIAPAIVGHGIVGVPAVGSSGFVGLDVEKHFGGGSDQVITGSADPILFDNVRHDTNGFATAVAGTPSACTVLPAFEGDWEVDLFVFVYANGTPVVWTADICLNGVAVTGGNFTADNPDSLPSIDCNIAIPAYTFYGLVAGDVISTLANASGGGTTTIGTGTYMRCRWLGPASPNVPWGS